MPEDKAPEEQVPVESSPEITPAFEWPTTPGTDAGPTEPTDEVAPVVESAPIVAEEASPEPVVAPAAAPVFGSDASSSVPTPPKAPKKKKMIIIGAIIIGALGLLSGGTAAAYNLWYQNPDKVVMDAVGSLLQSGTSTHKITLDVKTKDVAMKISVDAKVAESPASEADINATLTYGGKDYTVKGATLTDKDGNLYLKLNDVKALLTEFVGSETDLSSFNDLITKVDGQWIKVSSDDLKSVSEDYSKTQTCVTNALKSLDDKATIDELTDVYKKNQFIVVGDKIGAKDVDGTASLGYKVTIDEAKTKSFYTSLGETKVGKALTACDSSFDFKASDLDSSTDNSKTTTEAQVWASRFGHQLTEFDVTSKDNDGTTATVVWNPKFVKGVTVETPAKSVPVNELMTDIGNAYSNYYTSLYSSYSSDYSTNFSSDSATANPLGQLFLK